MILDTDVLIWFLQGNEKATNTVLESMLYMGRMFVQFVALCYYEYLSEQIREMKLTLAVETGDPAHDSRENMKVETKIRNWLKNTPVYLALQWFAVIEEVNVSSKLHAKRWTTELTERDKMFLRKLGMQVS